MSGGHQVLVIDDDASIRECFEEILRLQGFEVKLAENGRKALDLIEYGGAASPDLILTDLCMPVMDGRSFLNELWSRFPNLTAVPIILTTAASRQTLQNLPPLQLSILPKPMSFEQLVETVRQALEASSQISLHN